MPRAFADDPVRLRLFNPGENSNASDAFDFARKVHELCQIYLDCNRRRLAKASFDKAQRILRDFADRFGELEVCHLKPYHLDQWINDHPQWKSDWTTSRNQKQLLITFRWAARQGLIDTNPLANVTPLPWGPPRDPVAGHHYHRMLRAADPAFRALLAFSKTTGPRPEEIRELLWSQLNLDMTPPAFVLKKHKTARKTRRHRLIYLSTKALKLLEWVRRRNPHSKHVFLNSRGQPWKKDSLCQKMRRCRRRAGVPESAKLYSLRHTFATQAIIRGCDIVSLAELLGHTTTRMTEHYLHLAGNKPHLAAAVNRAAGSR